MFGDVTEPEVALETTTAPTVLAAKSMPEVLPKPLLPVVGRPSGWTMRAGPSAASSWWPDPAALVKLRPGNARRMASAASFGGSGTGDEEREDSEEKDEAGEIEDCGTHKGGVHSSPCKRHLGGAPGGVGRIGEKPRKGEFGSDGGGGGGGVRGGDGECGAPDPIETVEDSGDFLYDRASSEEGEGW